MDRMDQAGRLLAIRQSTPSLSSMAGMSIATGRAWVRISAVICTPMYSPVNPSNAHLCQRPPNPGVGFIKGQRSFEIRDPDDALIEFVERPAVEPFGLWGAGNTALVGGG